MGGEGAEQGIETVNASAPPSTPPVARRDAVQARDGFAMLVGGALLFWIPVLWPIGVMAGVIGALLVLSGARALGPDGGWDAKVASGILLVVVIGGAFLAGLVLGLNQASGGGDIFRILLVGQALLSAVFGLALVLLLSPALDGGGRALLGVASAMNLLSGVVLVFVFGPLRAALGDPYYPSSFPTNLSGAIYMMRYGPIVYGLAAPWYAVVAYRARSRILVPARSPPPEVTSPHASASPPTAP